MPDDARMQATVASALRAAVDADQEASGISPNDLDAAQDTPRVAAAIAAFLHAMNTQGRRAGYNLACDVLEAATNAR